MGVIVNKTNEQENELTRRINADLRQKTIAGEEIEGETPDLAEDSEYVQNFKKTGKFSWVWVVLIFLAILSLISIILI